MGYWLDENIWHFDTRFFGISPAEAEIMDPQHRLLLENVYEAMESAGLAMEDLQGTDTGVFVGMMATDYSIEVNQDAQAASSPLLATGTSRAMASNRISFTFDFRGPSMTIDTACSSSMMAVHLAVAALRRGDCQVAFACGSNLMLVPGDFVLMTKMNMVSPDGRSKMWDRSADGYGRGEGVAVICLKPRDAAVRDGDHIEAIIRETATNQDGRTKAITLPSAEAQASLIRKTYRNAGLNLAQATSRPQYFEAHGTGTRVGDPLEAEAINSAFFPPDREHSDDEVLYIGSIKSIIGHTEATAGLAGLLRATLAVRYGMIPPNLLYERLNPDVSPFVEHLQLVSAVNPWPTVPANCPRRASINSFGFGGSNVHVIIESHESVATRRVSTVPFMNQPLFTPFTFSAPSEPASMALMGQYLKYLEEQGTTVSLRDLVWTLQYRRSQFSCRCAISATSLGDLCRQLRYIVGTSTLGTENQHFDRACLSVQPRVMAIFTGQGAQWASMGKELITKSAYASRIMARLESALASLPDEYRPEWSLKDELLIESGKSRINEAILSQPLTTAIQILLVNLLKTAGVRFHVVLGHFSGEIAAAYASGYITAEYAIRTAYFRGLFSTYAGGKHGQNGAMLVTYLNPEEAFAFCSTSEFKGRIVVAAYNSPSISTLSGDADAIELAIERLDTRGIFVRELRVERAYHSHHMQTCVEMYHGADAFWGVSSSLEGEQPLWFSSVYPGKRMGRQPLQKSYWIDNMLQPVRFMDAVASAVSKTGLPDMFLEIGPNTTLKKPVQQIMGESAKDIHYVGLLKRGSDSMVTLSAALGCIWTRFGRAAVDFNEYEKRLSGGSQPRLLKDLFCYPWQHDKEYRVENRSLCRRFAYQFPPNELLGEEIHTEPQNMAKWRQFLNVKDTPWILEHALDGVPVLPASAYVAMITAAVRRMHHKRTIRLIDVQDLQLELPINFDHVAGPRGDGLDRAQHLLFC
ncbi:ketoacyl-synt-domain-containing protein [Sporormia fimetaria CBS 119925]|uniref:Ketoacyl-synt-domain-containing protein n=1 Tax=Sporormia fimetaria CBS 119925 TaxID=1340428 RepID=A0A6A6VDH1_9PLEO|nr:ketoacyl-synt-domain-containing protein [Sporormia fimetaria CBS 119925]